MYKVESWDFSSRRPKQIERRRRKQKIQKVTRRTTKKMYNTWHTNLQFFVPRCLMVAVCVGEKGKNQNMIEVGTQCALWIVFLRNCVNESKKRRVNLVRFSNVSNRVHVGYETKIYFFIRVHLRCCLPFFLFFMMKITTELVPNERWKMI